MAAGTTRRGSRKTKRLLNQLVKGSNTGESDPGQGYRKAGKGGSEKAGTFRIIHLLVKAGQGLGRTVVNRQKRERKKKQEKRALRQGTNGTKANAKREKGHQNG